MQTDKYPVFGALFGVALILGIVGYAGYSMYPTAQWTWFQWITAFSGVIYLALALLSLKQPLPCSIVGTILFVGWLGYLACVNFTSLTTGWIFKGPIFVLLVYALISALKRKAKQGT